MRLTETERKHLDMIVEDVIANPRTYFKIELTNRNTIEVVIDDETVAEYFGLIRDEQGNIIIK